MQRFIKYDKYNRLPDTSSSGPCICIKEGGNMFLFCVLFWRWGKTCLQDILSGEVPRMVCYFPENFTPTPSIKIYGPLILFGFVLC